MADQWRAACEAVPTFELAPPGLPGSGTSSRLARARPATPLAFAPSVPRLTMFRNATRLSSTARLPASARSYATATETAQAGGRRLRSALLSSALTLGTVGFLYYTHDASAGFNK